MVDLTAMATITMEIKYLDLGIIMKMGIDTIMENTIKHKMVPMDIIKTEHTINI